MELTVSNCQALSSGLLQTPGHGGAPLIGDEPPLPNHLLVQPKDVQGGIVAALRGCRAFIKNSKADRRYGMSPEARGIVSASPTKIDPSAPSPSHPVVSDQAREAVLAPPFQERHQVGFKIILGARLEQGPL